MRVETWEVDPKDWYGSDDRLRGLARLQEQVREAVQLLEQTEASLREQRRLINHYKGMSFPAPDAYIDDKIAELLRVNDPFEKITRGVPFLWQRPSLFTFILMGIFLTFARRQRSSKYDLLYLVTSDPPQTSLNRASILCLWEYVSIAWTKACWLTVKAMSLHRQMNLSLRNIARNCETVMCSPAV